jgi:hypothetical protein
LRRDGGKPTAKRKEVEKRKEVTVAKHFEKGEESDRA